MSIRNSGSIALDPEFIAQILDSLPTHIFWKDSRGVYQGCNTLFARSIGLQSVDEVIGKTDFDLPVEQESSAAYVRDDQEVMKSKKAKLNIEEKQMLTSGKEIVLLTSKVPLFDHEKKVIGILGVYTDITQQKKLESRVLQLTENEAQLKAMSAIGAMIAHELRTPIGALAMSLSNLEKFLPKILEGYEEGIRLGGEPKLRSDQMYYMKNIIDGMKRSVSYSGSTITSIIECVKINYEDGKASPENINLKEAVHHIVNSYPYDQGERELVEVKHIDDALVACDTKILTHVLYNLLKNAIHSINEVGNGSISIWTEASREHMCLFFEDTGKGIAKNDLPHVFEAFYTTKKKSANSIGIGLYFCKTALSKMHAEITCESDEGKYARFIIKIPRVSKS